MRLHIGCGDRRLPKPWHNCDGDPSRTGTMLLRLPEDLREFATGSVEWIYSSHTIEHVEFDSLPAMFAEFHRILRPGGKITLATIDINGIYHNRYKKGVRAASWNAALYGETWGMGRPFISHMCCFDLALLADLLTRAGFSNVRLWEPSQYPEILALHDCATTDRDVSLLLEADA